MLSLPELKFDPWLRVDQPLGFPEPKKGKGVLVHPDFFFQLSISGVGPENLHLSHVPS